MVEHSATTRFELKSGAKLNIRTWNVSFFEKKYLDKISKAFLTSAKVKNTISREKFPSKAFSSAS